MRYTLLLYVAFLLLLSGWLILLRIQPSTAAFIAFTSDRDGGYDVYLIHPDGHNLTQLTTRTSYDVPLQWLDEHTILIDTQRQGDQALRLLDIRSRHIQQVSFDPFNKYLVAVSPHGDIISYSIVFRSGNSDIYRLEIANSRRENLTNSPAHEFWGRWSPDGQWLAYQADTIDRNMDIWRMRPDGGDKQRLTENQEREIQPEWSPNGQWIGYLSEGDLWVMQPDGSNPRRLTSSATILNGFSWSPDSQWLAYDAADQHIYRIQLTGGKPQPLTALSGYHEHPTWGPGWLVYTYLNPQPFGKWALVVMAPDGSSQHQLTSNGYSDIGPVVSPAVDMPNRAGYLLIGGLGVFIMTFITRRRFNQH